jgi:hypothetical protein
MLDEVCLFLSKLAVLYMRDEADEGSVGMDDEDQGDKNQAGGEG